MAYHITLEITSTGVVPSGTPISGHLIRELEDASPTPSGTDELKTQNGPGEDGKQHLDNAPQG